MYLPKKDSQKCLDTGHSVFQRSVNFKMSFWCHHLDQNTYEQISILEFEKWSNLKIKAFDNVFNTLKSPHNHM